MELKEIKLVKCSSRECDVYTDAGYQVRNEGFLCSDCYIEYLEAFHEMHEGDVITFVEMVVH